MRQALHRIPLVDNTTSLSRYTACRSKPLTCGQRTRTRCTHRRWGLHDGHTNVLRTPISSTICWMASPEHPCSVQHASTYTRRIRQDLTPRWQSCCQHQGEHRRSMLARGALRVSCLISSTTFLNAPELGMLTTAYQ